MTERQVENHSYSAQPWVAILVLAVAYGLTAYLSTYLRIPPSFSACIYPPAGIAMAMFLIYGWRVWPGVAIGAAVISPSLGSGSFTLDAIAVSMLLSAAAVAQYAAGRWLVLRFLGYPLALTSEKEIAKFCLIAGPVACLVNSTASNAVLFALGMIPASTVALSWATWWIGDVLGVLLVAPVVLAFVGEPKAIWRARRLSVALPLAITLLAVFTLFFRASAWETHNTVAAAGRTAESVRDNLTDHIAHGNELLLSIERFYAGSVRVDEDEFSAFVRTAPQQHDALQRVFWIAADSTRSPGEPLALTYRVSANGRDLGPDTLANPLLTHLLHTLPREARLLTAPGNVGDPNAASSLTTLLPIYKQLSGDRVPRLLGYVGAEWSLALILRHAIDKTDDAQARIRVATVIDDKVAPLMELKPTQLQSTATSTARTHSEQLQINAITFLLEHTPSAHWLGEQRSWYSWTLLAGGLIFACMLCIMLLIASGNTARVQTVVNSRTAELTRANMILDTVTQTQADFITETDSNRLFDRLLERLLEVSESEYGFIGEIFYKIDGSPYLRTRAITNIAWNEETRRFYDQNAPQGLEFFNMNTLFGAAIVSGQPVISNKPRTDPRGGGTPSGHPPLKAFMGLPFHKGRDIMGVVGLANRPGGYSDDLVAELQPILSTMANIIDAHRMARRRDESEQRVRESESRTRAILDNAIDSIITIETDGRIESVNPATLRLFGYSEHELIGKDVSLLMAEPYRSTHAQYVARYLHAERRPLIKVPREFNAIHKDGRKVPIEISLSEIRVGKKRLFTAIIHDLTERKKVEQMKNEFISTVSHELRTPLTSIIGSLGLVLGGAIPGIPEKGREMIDIAKKNADRLVRLINDILDIEKIESGKMEFRLERQPLLPLVQQAIDATQGFAHRFNVSVALSGDERGSSQVSVDGDRLIQVINNLISNAIKFSPEHSTVEVKISAFAQQVRVDVIDHGPGIPEDFQKRLFQKFAQADSSDTRKHAGTGLGLTISKAIIERMGGRIGFETAPGEGTTFYFDLPLVSVKQTEPA